MSPWEDAPTDQNAYPDNYVSQFMNQALYRVSITRDAGSAPNVHARGHTPYRP